jgi:hypothetical protein
VAATPQDECDKNPEKCKNKKKPKTNTKKPAPKKTDKPPQPAQPTQTATQAKPASDQKLASVNSMEIFNGTFPKRGLPDDGKPVKNTENGTTSDTPFGFNLSVDYSIASDSKPLANTIIYEDNKAEVEFVVLEDGKLTTEKNKLDYSGIAGTTDKNGNFTDAPLGFSNDTPVKSIKITQTLYTLDSKGKREDLVTNTITGTTTLNVNGGKLTGNAAMTVTFSNSTTSKTFKIPALK